MRAGRGDNNVVDPEKIRLLIEMMAEHELTEISLRNGEDEIVLKRGGMNPAACLPPGAYLPQMAFAPLVMASPPGTPEAEPGARASEPDEDSDLVAIESPMVGTFYTAPSPESPAYVTEGSTVTPQTVVCTLEAMKVFNEIKAEMSGIIAKVLVKNEGAVEFGQPLFLVKPS